MRRRILIIDDDLVFCTMLKRHLEEEYLVTAFSDPEEAVQYLRANEVAAVLTDLNMPKVDGLEVLKIVKSEKHDTDVIIMTAYAQVDTAVEAMKRGAYDYIVKPFTTEELSLHMKNLFEKRGLVRENIELKKFLDLKYRPENIIGKSAAMKEVYRFIERVSKTDATVLITGESGTGKDLVARAIHFSGKRKDRRFISLHCGALPQWALESPLFSGETGPGGAGERFYKESNSGTIVLSEIGDLDMSLQSKFLAAIENRDVIDSPGEKGPFSYPMVIATTNKDLSKLQLKGRFRKDLFHRLNMFSLSIPPLRERKEDIPLLAEHFFLQYKNEFEKPYMELSQGALEVLQKYDWPGNVRELKGLFAKICLLEDADVILPEDLLRRLPKSVEEHREPGSVLSLHDIERDIITQTLRQEKGNMTTASRLLNISYDTLRSRMKKFGIERRDYRTK